MIQSLGKAPVDVHRITVPWQERTVTWNSFGAGYDPAPILTFPTLGVPNNSGLSIDLTRVWLLYDGGRSHETTSFHEPEPRFRDRVRGDAVGVA
jgi:hypothetical protein